MSYFKLLSNLLFIVIEALNVIETSCNSKYGQHFWFKNVDLKWRQIEYLFILGLFHNHYRELSCKRRCIGHWITVTGLFSNRKLNCLQFSEDFIHFLAPIFAVSLLHLEWLSSVLPFIILCHFYGLVIVFLLWKAFSEHPYHAPLQVIKTIQMYNWSQKYAPIFILQ